MSYDFMLMRLRGVPGTRPMAIPPDLAEDACFPIANGALLFDAARAALAPETLSPIERGFRWRTPDGGQLDVNVAAPAISINCHAHWDHVATVYELARGLWSDVVLMDLQSVELHDAASLRAYAVDHYDTEERQRARRAAKGADA
jgi:hypothetical protein